MAEPAALAERGASQRLVVVWRVTTRCNLSCAFCAYDRTRTFSRRDAGELLARNLGVTLANERARSGRELHVSFLGGEPFLWEPLPRVARDFSRLGLSLGVTTNGTGLGNPASLELLLDCFDEVTLSVDGLAGVHDRLRGWPGGFQRLASVVHELIDGRRRRGRGPLVRVNTVLMRDNLGQFPALCRTLAVWGVDELTFNRLGDRDRPEFFAEHRLTPADLERFSQELPELRRELGARGLRVRGTSAYLERLASLERGERVAVADCQPGERFLFMNEQGSLAPCSFTLDSYGEALPEHANSPDLSLVPRRFLARQRSKRVAACDDCASTHVFEKFRGE